MMRKTGLDSFKKIKVIVLYFCMFFCLMVLTISNIPADTVYAKKTSSKKTTAKKKVSKKEKEGTAHFSCTVSNLSSDVEIQFEGETEGTNQTLLFKAEENYEKTVTLPTGNYYISAVKSTDESQITYQMDDIFDVMEGAITEVSIQVTGNEKGTVEKVTEAPSEVEEEPAVDRADDNSDGSTYVDDEQEPDEDAEVEQEEDTEVLADSDDDAAVEDVTNSEESTKTNETGEKMLSLSFFWEILKRSLFGLILIIIGAVCLYKFRSKN